jgi:coenzyme Q-binding protein COQ10
MPYHQETRFLPYTPTQMFDLVADIKAYPQFLPWCKRAVVLSRGRKIIVADLVIGYKLFQEKFTSEVTLDRPRAISVNYRSGPLAHLSNVWEFAPGRVDKRKGCALSFTVDFDFKSPLLRAAMSVFFDKALSRMVEAFEARAADLYGG